MSSKAFQIMGCKIEQCGHHRNQQGKTDAGSLHFKINASDDEHDENAADDGVYQEGNDLVNHDKYGEGIISENNDLTYKVIFVRGGEVEFSKMNASFEVVKPNVNEDEDLRPRLDVKDFERALTFILGKYNAIENRVALGKKWEGGTMILQPANPELKPKEIPVETFFHKIVMMRESIW